MVIKETLNAKNFNSIKDINLKYPELMSDNAKNEIFDLISNINQIKEDIYETRNKVLVLEKILQLNEDKLKNIKCLFDIEYSTEQIEVAKETEAFGIRGLGNSTLGEQSVI